MSRIGSDTKFDVRYPNGILQFGGVMKIQESKNEIKNSNKDYEKKILISRNNLNIIKFNSWIKIKEKEVRAQEN